jgi:hypothetical protein
MARIRRVWPWAARTISGSAPTFAAGSLCDHEDHHTCLAFLAKDATGRQLRNPGDRLMTNHIHSIPVPTRANSLSLTTRGTQRDSSR